jgi:hypothetical protein
MCSIG